MPEVAEQMMVAAERMIAAKQTPSLLTKFASKFGVEPSKMLATLKATAFRSVKGDISNEMMMGLLIVADQYNLNPWTKEIHAFYDEKTGAIVPVVGVDGWSRLCNEHAQFNGLEFKDSQFDEKGLPRWIECTIFRKDREHPTTAREYMDECKRATGPWGSHPRRMLRHKAFIQCARLAFGFVGIYDEDEAERIIEGEHSLASEAPAAIENINKAIAPRAVDAPIALEIPVTEEPVKPPLDLSGGPSYAEVMEFIHKAKNDDDVDAATAMADDFEEQQRAEIDVEARARKTALKKK